jgi:hypothetical protein
MSPSRVHSQPSVEHALLGKVPEEELPGDIDDRAVTSLR